MSQPVQVALLGCGAVARQYYSPALRELEKINCAAVAAVFDPNPHRAASLRQVFPAAASLGSLDELSRHNVDLAIVASPTRYHAEQSIHALNQGISVLCEKPMAATVVEAEAMLQAARAAQKILAVGLFRRFFAATQTIREFLSQRLLGEVKSFSYTEGSRFFFFWPAQSASFFEKSEAKGGVLLDLGAHGLDLLLWWLGEPTAVSYQDDAMGGVEANCRIELRFAEGFTGKVQFSRDWSLPNRCIIECERGWLGWPMGAADKLQFGIFDAAFCLDAQLFERPKNVGSLGPTQSAANYHQSFVHQLLNVVEAVRGNGQPLVPGEEGIRSLRLIDYCYQNRTLLPMPWLSEVEFRRAEQLTARGNPS